MSKRVCYCCRAKQGYVSGMTFIDGFICENCMPSSSMSGVYEQLKAHFGDALKTLPVKDAADFLGCKVDVKNTTREKRKAPIFSIILLGIGLALIIYSVYTANQWAIRLGRDTPLGELFGGSELTFFFISGIPFILLSAVSFAWRFRKPKSKSVKPFKGYTPVTYYSENTGSAKMDAINAEYNAKMRQAVSNLASSDPKAPKSATGAMVKGAVVGKLIGGDGGAVVGAMIAKQKHDEKNK